MANGVGIVLAGDPGGGWGVGWLGELMREDRRGERCVEGKLFKVIGLFGILDRTTEWVE